MKNHFAYWLICLGVVGCATAATSQPPPECRNPSRELNACQRGCELTPSFGKAAELKACKDGCLGPFPGTPSMDGCVNDTKEINACQQGCALTPSSKKPDELKV